MTVVEKMHRDRQSRNRAWEAYVRAGGTLEFEPHDDDAITARKGIGPHGLSVRAYKAMRFELQCTTLAELAELSTSDVLDARNVGTTTLAELREALRLAGLQFKDERE